MKKFLFFLMIFPIFVSAQFDAKYEAHKYVRVKPPMTKYFKQLVHFYRSNGVDIDWRLVKEMKFQSALIDANTGTYFAGYFGRDHIIRIGVRQDLAVQYGIYDKVIMAIIAHELAHSQGIEHDEKSILMYPTNGPMYNAFISKNVRLTDVLLEPYIKK